MTDNATPVEILFEKAEKYGKTTLEVLKLRALSLSAEVASSLAVKLAVFTVVALFTFILNIGIALWLGELMGKSYYGFFVIAGFYVLLAVLIYLFRDQWIKIPVSNSVITQMFTKKNK
jgi:phosphoglycerol transferase MdoB-like AlkP superfamily enzyme